MAPAQKKIRVLLVEDNPSDVLLVRRALAFHQIECEWSFATDGEKALDEVRRAEAGEVAFDLILVDLNLPCYDGGYIVNAARATRTLGKTPIILITSSDSPQDLRRLTELGANRYFHKPLGLSAFMDVGQVVKDVMATRDPA